MMNTSAMPTTFPGGGILKVVGNEELCRAYVLFVLFDTRESRCQATDAAWQLGDTDNNLFFSRNCIFMQSSFRTVPAQMWGLINKQFQKYAHK